MGPLVSLCTPTTSARRHFLEQSWRYVLRQSYRGPLEWVIVDGSSKPESDALTATLAKWFASQNRVSITYRNVPLGRPVGWMRNHANRAASGDIILHWDDDDWYGPTSVEKRTAALTPQIDVVDVSTYHVLHTGPEPYAEPSITWKQNRKGSGNTLGYWKRVWQAQPFTTHIAEDRTFVRKFYNRMLSLRDDSLVIYVRHSGNTCEWPRTDRDSTPRVRELMGEDFEFYRRLSNVAM